VLDEVSQSYSHQRNSELDQIGYTIETRDQEFVDSRITRLLSRIYAFCEKGHVIMDCPFMFFHIRADIVKHVEI
jgi:very-short-patch-repair endonuclease